MKLAVAIATAGRPEILAPTLAHIAGQTRQADKILICPAAPADIDAGLIADTGCAIEVVFGKRGLTSQRNTLIDAASDADLLVFFDDDFFAAPDYLRAADALFAAEPDIVMLTGMVLADGITGPGLSASDADARLAAAPGAGNALTPVYNGYGCNMAVRLDPVRTHAIRFDEALPLYGWLEDVDFSRRMAPYGRILKSEALQGVHLGTKRGRNSGLRFGYSQIANPLYMVSRDTLSPRRALAQISRNLAMNITRSPVPEAWIDRRGRLQGNALALADLVRGRLSPSRILDLG